jgi:monoamine oxidase
MRQRGTHDVAVIGAGLAGLHAALLLEAQGLDVCVLEAQPRIGGRVHSMRQLGSNAEAGGTYIGAGYERIMRTAARFGIRLIDVSPILEFFREQDLVLGTTLIRQAEWPEHPANPFPERDRTLLPWNYHRVLTLRENPLKAPEDWLNTEHAVLDVSMYSWMRGLGLSDDVIKIGYGINTSFGADAHDVSALLLLFRAAFSKAQRKLATEVSLGYTVEHGVQRIPEAMASALRNAVALECVVVALTQTHNAVRVECADGSYVGAKRVVCSLPFGVLRRVKLDPPLQGLQAEAVHELCAQPITQVYLGARRPFWNDDGYAASLFTDSLPGMVAAVRSGTDPGTITHLTAWIMGNHARALEGLTEAQVGQHVIGAIERIRPAARGQLELIGMHAWGADPYAAGAWAYFRPGQIRRFASAMHRTHGRVHFCGEHLAVASRGMEAALETAERAAAEVLGNI